MRSLARLQLLLVAASLLAACDTIDAPTDPVTGAPMLWPEGQKGGVNAKSAALTAAGSCTDVEAQLREMVIREMVATLQASFASSLESRESCHSWLWDGSGDAMAAKAAPEASQTSNTSPQHSETNNQVAGVDEADLVKTDGNYLYQVGNGAFRIFRSWPAAATAQLARVEIEGSPKKLFVLGDRALVYSSLDGGASAAKSSPWQRYGGDCTYGYDCVPTGDGHPTKITVLDLADRNLPRLVRELVLSSSFLAARRIGSAIHTVVTTAPKRVSYKTYPDLDACDVSRVELYQAFRNLLLTNLATLKNAALELERPTLVDRVHGAAGVTENGSPLLDCRSFLRSSLGDGGQMTSLVSLAIDDQRPASAVTIVSKAGVVYASEGALYLAEPRLRSNWGWFDALQGSSDATTIHKFALDNAGAAARYLASGLIKGRVLNQLALDEQKGFLRIATTTGRVSKGSASVHNSLSVLSQRGERLEPVGGIDEIAPGEDIRSVRFDGDRGYIVTFKKTDPLFVLDLADPGAPRVLAELKIPGFSTYMHRMDANHLLTIGYDGDDQGNFAWFTGVALQIFDVSDGTQPKLKWKHVIGTRGSSSEALTDHLAFTYYAEKNLLALPLTVCEGSTGGGSYGDQLTFSGLLVFDVTPAKGFSLRGKIGFQPGAGATCSNWWTDASSQVKRSLVIENTIYALSEDRLKADGLEALGAGLVDLPLN
jgi:hypothetical protein